MIMRENMHYQINHRKSDFKNLSKRLWKKQIRNEISLYEEIEVMNIVNRENDYIKIKNIMKY